MVPTSFSFLIPHLFRAGLLVCFRAADMLHMCFVVHAASFASCAMRNLWPAFKTQQKLQEQIRNVKLHVDAVPWKKLLLNFNRSSTDHRSFLHRWPRLPRGLCSFTLTRENQSEKRSNNLAYMVSMVGWVGSYWWVSMKRDTEQAFAVHAFWTMISGRSHQDARRVTNAII